MRRIVVDTKFLVLGILLGVIAIVLVVVLSGGSIIGPKYHTLPRPTLQNTPLTRPTPACVEGTAKQHVMGTCLPQPKPGTPQPVPQTRKTASIGPRYTLAATTTGITGPDFSNNDPVYGDGPWSQIAGHSKFVYLKSVEGTGYYDSTAAPMARYAKAHGLPVGGYDFMHVCGVSASQEAAFFVRALYAQGLLGAGTLPPSADVEYGSGNCGGRVWVQTWVDTVYAQDGHVCPIAYTGAWWWQPNIGGWWPTCQNVQLKSWVSGYGVSYPYMPAGIAHLDLWQFADNGFNGYNYKDESAWNSPTSFASFAGGAAPPPPDKYRILDKTRRDLGHKVKAAEYWTVKTWDRNHCGHPARRLICTSSRDHARLLAYRIDSIACRAPHPVATGAICNYRVYRRQQRRAWLSRVGAA